MRPVNVAVLTTISLLVIGMVLGPARQTPLGLPPAQAADVPVSKSEGGQWVRLNDYTAEVPFPIWVNLGRADSIRFYTGNYGTQQNVPRASIIVGRDIIQVNAPAEIALLRRYVQSHRLG